METDEVDGDVRDSSRHNRDGSGPSIVARRMRRAKAVPVSTQQASNAAILRYHWSNFKIWIFFGILKKKSVQLFSTIAMLDRNE